MLFCSLQMTESDGEVSQFDSLDNCSDGGMSAENFNTLKKGPLAPIDPPPQFQVNVFVFSTLFIYLMCFSSIRTHRSQHSCDHRNFNHLLLALPDR